MGREWRIFTSYPSGDASRRLRIDPLVSALGRDVVVDTLMSEKAFAAKNGNLRQRGRASALLALGLLRRVWRVWRCPRGARVLIHREAFPFMTPLFEMLLRRRASVLVVDVDDALYTHPGHGKDWRRFLRRPARFDDVLAAADVVLAGSPALAQRAERLGSRAVLAPTCPPPTA